MSALGIALLALGGALWLVALLAACKSQSPAGDPDAQASPQALATPAPLSSVAAPTASALTTTTDAGPPPVPLRFDEARCDKVVTVKVPGSRERPE